MGPIVAVEGSRVEVRDSAVDASDRAAVAVCGRAPVAGGLRTVTRRRRPGRRRRHRAGRRDRPARVHRRSVGSTAPSSTPPTRCWSPTLATGDPRKVAVHARRRQVGCVRYSFVPEGSRIGKRYRCAPHPDDPPCDQGRDHAAVHQPCGSATRPTSSWPPPRRTRSARGADDESEMGVTHLLFTPQRESNLLLRLDEYLRFGLEAGFFYAT